MTGYERYEILHRASELMVERAAELSKIITLEEGKPVSEADIEVARATEIIALSAEEAKRLGGEVLPLDGAPGVRDKLGFTLRVPCGVVVGISPFNFPLHLVCHKAGPAFAAGNAVILKPATDTPLSGLKIVEILVDAGAPPEAVQCLTGSGRRDRRRALRGPARAQDHLHRQPRRGRAHLQGRGPEEGDHGARLQRAVRGDARRRPGEGGQGGRHVRLFQRRAGLHLHAARAGARGHLRRLRGCLQGRDGVDQHRQSAA